VIDLGEQPTADECESERDGSGDRHSERHTDDVPDPTERHSAERHEPHRDHGVECHDATTELVRYDQLDERVRERHEQGLAGTDEKQQHGRKDDPLRQCEGDERGSEANIDEEEELAASPALAQRTDEESTAERSGPIDPHQYAVASGTGVQNIPREDRHELEIRAAEKTSELPAA